ncbi:hypothetical protein PGTUg99_033826 [Puccinia graminis f. sp. tritici]|uniref:Uncharacterized protein n=2 Tax=Puccinia graminis f. sp. tritici TaxID=56615 RepID=E3L5V3_PUCGT|nr:uncharacterized protein PGTG_17955 [Puccinia graminis f. sp. tritici CRL 75-36-700-3]EFP91928.2 hypothetical protein PGTG_17955 [Puccinia graminis f. sp. tritici CRL 75-36-700-3]KAA1122209.1 hypothetical protein PGTUg99_033826 [Puccinia graminis f. sp. tritici]
MAIKHPALQCYSSQFIPQDIYFEVPANELHHPHVWQTNHQNFLFHHHAAASSRLIQHTSQKLPPNRCFHQMLWSPPTTSTRKAMNKKSSWHSPMPLKTTKISRRPH